MCIRFKWVSNSTFPCLGSVVHFLHRAWRENQAGDPVRETGNAPTKANHWREYYMDTTTWFDDLPVLGNMPPEEAAAKLREMGEEETAATLETAQEAQAQTFKLGERSCKAYTPTMPMPSPVAC